MAIPSQLMSSVEKRLSSMQIESEYNDLSPTEWGKFHFRHMLKYDFSLGQTSIWDWAGDLPLDVSPDPHIVIMARGGGKSSTAESVATYIGCLKKRSYVLYVRCTQDQADKSVTNISSLLTNPLIAANYPLMADKKVDTFGTALGWRRELLRTASNFVVEGIGLDSATRGAKIDQNRPDLIILDDIDELFDSPKVTQKKIDAIRKTILPAGSDNCAVLAIQNLMIENGFFDQLHERKIDVLSDATRIGPIPAIEDLEYKTSDKGIVITGGRATWSGQSLEVCQKKIRTIGLESFLQEMQHEVKNVKKSLFNEQLINRVKEYPNLVRIVTSLDVATWSGRCGIVSAGIDAKGIVYILSSESCEAEPEIWTEKVIDQYLANRSEVVVYEKNQGGKTIPFSLRTVKKSLPCLPVWASNGKITRAGPVKICYVNGSVKHVGDHPELESQMIRYKAGDTDSPDLLDAMVWAVTELKGLSVEADEQDEQDFYVAFATGGIQRIG